MKIQKQQPTIFKSMIEHAKVAIVGFAAAGGVYTGVGPFLSPGTCHKLPLPIEYTRNFCIPLGENPSDYSVEVKSSAGLIAAPIGAATGAGFGGVVGALNGLASSLLARKKTK